MSNEIIYNGETIASFESSKTVTIPCAGKRMVDDIVIKSKQSTNVNLAFGDSPPDDTNKLWLKTPTPSKTIISSDSLSLGHYEFDATAELFMREDGTKMTWVSGKLYKAYTLDGEICVKMYDPLSRTCEVISTMPCSKSGVCAIAAKDTTLYIVFYSGIVTFDIETKTFEVFDVNTYVNGTHKVAIVDSKLYAFRLENSGISIFDLETCTFADSMSCSISNKYNVSLSVVGTDIYIFGGNNSNNIGSGTSYNTIHKLDTITQEISRLDITLPYALSGIASVSVGDYIYLFGGSEKSSGTKNDDARYILKFDTVNNVINKLSSKLVFYQWGLCAGNVGSKIYLTGGNAYAFSSYGVEFTGVYQYDIDNDTLNVTSPTFPASGNNLSVSVDKKIYSFNNKHAYIYDTESKKTTILYDDKISDNPFYASNGSKIYLFGGYDTTSICVFNTDDNSLELLPVELPIQLTQSAVVSTGSMIYVLGGLTGENMYDINMNSSSIYAFDTEKYTITLLSETLQIPVCQPSYALIDSILYIIGGYNGSNVLSIQTFDIETHATGILPLTLPFSIWGQNTFVIDRNIYLLYAPTQAIVINADSYAMHVWGSLTKPIIGTNHWTICNVHNTVYILGGGKETTSKDLPIDNVARLALSNLNAGVLCITSSTTDNIFKIVYDDNFDIEIGIESAMIGSDTNLPSPVNAYLYNGSEWALIT